MKKNTGVKIRKMVQVSEKVLADLVRENSDSLEKGLIYVGQMIRGGRHLLCVDRRKSLVVVEVATDTDDSLLIQAIDFYDYISQNMGKVVKKFKNINPTKTVRVFLISPSFSKKLLNRCKWIKIPISLFNYRCIQMDEGIQAVFPREKIPAAHKKV